MRIDLYPYLVPLGLIAIWALTSIFNRETQPLPPRTTTRPLGPPQLRPTPTRPSPSMGNAQSPSRPGSRRDDDIVILDDAPRRSTGGRVGSTPGRRGTKARPSPASTPSKPEPIKQSLLSQSLIHPESPKSIQAEVFSHTESLKPLSLPPSPLLTTPNDEAARTQADRALVSRTDSFSSAEIRKLTQTPARLREGFILAELLKPPVSLREGRSFSRPKPPTKS